MSLLKVSEKLSSRDVVPDLLKGISIFGVVWIHSDAPFAHMFVFCVPVFVGVWSFFLEKWRINNKIFSINEYYYYFFRKFLLIFFQFLIWSSFYIFIRWFYDGISQYGIKTILFGLLGGYGFAGQYYFLIIIQIFIIFPIVFFNRSKFYVISIAIISFLISWILIFLMKDNVYFAKISYRPFFYWLSYVAVGVALAHGYLKIPVWTLIFVPFVLIGSKFEIKYIGKMAEYQGVFVMLASYLLLFTMGSKYFSQVISNIYYRGGIFFYIIGFFSYLGSRSFSIFVMNPLFVSIYKFIFGVGVIGVALTICLAIASSVLVGIMLERLKLGVLVGKQAANARLPALAGNRAMKR